MIVGVYLIKFVIAFLEIVGQDKTFDEEDFKNNFEQKITSTPKFSISSEEIHSMRETMFDMVLKLIEISDPNANTKSLKQLLRTYVTTKDIPSTAIMKKENGIGRDAGKLESDGKKQQVLSSTSVAKNTVRKQEKNTSHSPPKDRMMSSANKQPVVLQTSRVGHEKTNAISATNIKPKKALPESLRQVVNSHAIDKAISASNQSYRKKTPEIELLALSIADEKVKSASEDLVGKKSMQKRKVNQCKISLLKRIKEKNNYESYIRKKHENDDIIQFKTNDEDEVVAVPTDDKIISKYVEALKRTLNPSQLDRIIINSKYLMGTATIFSTTQPIYYHM